MNSMTGFGRAECVDPKTGLTLRIELSSVNRKQFDLKFSLPKDFAFFETELRMFIAERISRGALTFRLESERHDPDAAGAPSMKINLAAMESLIRAVKELQKKYPIQGDLTPDGLLSVPGIVEIASPDLHTESFKECLLHVTEEAVKKFLEMRHAEGERLKADIEKRLAFLKQNADEIREIVKDYPKEQYEKMRAHLQSAGFQAEADDERLLREFVIFADKCDVTEELTRLDSHFVHFKELMNSQTPSGRALDFLVQETFREINTLGNKAPGPQVSPRIVAMKTELEKIREQIQNIE